MTGTRTIAPLTLVTTLATTLCDYADTKIFRPLRT